MELAALELLLCCFGLGVRIWFPAEPSSATNGRGRNSCGMRIGRGANTGDGCGPGEVGGEVIATLELGEGGGESRWINGGRAADAWSEGKADADDEAIDETLLWCLVFGV